MSETITDEKIMMPDNKMVIAGEEFVIKPFVIRTRTKVLNIVVGLFSEIAGKKDLKDTPNIEFLNDLILAGGDRLIEIYEMVIPRDRQWIEDNVTLPDEIKLVKTIWEINNFPLLQGQFQKMIEKYIVKKQQ